MEILGLLVLAIILVLVGVGLVLGLFAVALGVGLVGVGVVSTSAIVGLLRRNPADAMRALFLQLGVLGGVPAGIVAVLLLSWAAQAQLADDLGLLLLGGLGGMLGGVLVALVFNAAWGLAVKWVNARVPATNRGIGQAGA